MGRYRAGAFFLFFVGAAGLIGLAAAIRTGRNERLPVETRRRRYKALALYPVFAAITLHMPFMITYLHTQHPQAIADLWFSSSSFSVLVPFLAIGPAAMALLLPIATRQERRLFGLPPTVTPIPMSPEERAVQQRLARWNRAPHLAGLLAIGAGPLLLPRNSHLSPVLHPLLFLFPVVGTVLISRLFRKPLAAFTRISPDDGLTWRARQLGMQMGVRPQEVQVEDSSKAAHNATMANDRGGHILISRKMLDVMSPDELEFLLAHQVALMKVKAAWTPLMRVMLVPGLLPLALCAWLWTGHPAQSALALMPYLLPVMFLPFLVILFQGRRGDTPSVRRALEADRVALAVTGNPAAAQSALAKLAKDAPAIPGQAAGSGVLLTDLGLRLKALAALAPISAGAKVR